MMSLLLHEEIVHQEHCSIVGLSANAARDGRSVVAQNWDWPATVYAWPKIVRSRTNGAPAIMTYAFPGLWACAGVNDAGLAIGWSGAGYWPSVPPIPGIPTYALVAGVLASQDVSSAIRLLGNRRHAGCFIFFLADRGGELAVVEGWPGHLAVARNEMIAARTNHYVMPNVIAVVNQRDPFSIRDSTTAPRLESLRALLSRNQEWITGNVLREILCHQEIRASYSLDTSGHGYNSMTIDSFCMYPDTAELLVARGLPDRHDFIRYTLASSQRDEQPVIHQEVAQNGRNSGTGSHPGAGTR